MEQELPPLPSSIAEVPYYVQKRWHAALSTADPRTTTWPLVDSPVPMLFFVTSYLVVVRYGPKFMQSRQPLELKPVMIVYNFLVALLSLYMTKELFLSAAAAGYNYKCDLVDYSNTPNALRMASVVWWYYFSKIVELLDTVFFILRKKNNQITFLHVYHHSTMVFLWWIGVKWYAGGASFFSAMLNSGVHVVMYTYYLLSAFGPVLQKYLWWKRYLTMLQLIQFSIILIHVSSSFFIDCGYDIKPRVALAIYLISHLTLFSNFFIQTYLKPKKGAKPKYSSTDNGTLPVMVDKKKEKKE